MIDLIAKLRQASSANKHLHPDFIEGFLTKFDGVGMILSQGHLAGARDFQLQTIQNTS